MQCLVHNVVFLFPIYPWQARLFNISKSQGIFDASLVVSHTCESGIPNRWCNTQRNLKRLLNHLLDLCRGDHSYFYSVLYLLVTPYVMCLQSLVPIENGISPFFFHFISVFSFTNFSRCTYGSKSYFMIYPYHILSLYCSPFFICPLLALSSYQLFQTLYIVAVTFWLKALSVHHQGLSA